MGVGDLWDKAKKALIKSLTGGVAIKCEGGVYCFYSYNKKYEKQFFNKLNSTETDWEDLANYNSKDYVEEED